MAAPEPIRTREQEIAALVAKLKTGLMGQALSIASHPTTWRILHFALMADKEQARESEAPAAEDSPLRKKKVQPAPPYTKGLPEPLDFGSLWVTERRFIPEYRFGCDKISFAKELGELYLASQTRKLKGRERIAAAAQFLLRNLTGTSLMVLRRKVFLINSRKFIQNAPWWRSTPVPGLNRQELAQAIDSDRRLTRGIRRSGKFTPPINLVGVSQQLVSFFYAEVARAIEEFSHFDGTIVLPTKKSLRARNTEGTEIERPESKDEGAPEQEAAGRSDAAPFFRMSGSHKLREATKNYIKSRVRPRLAKAFMEVPWAEQGNPEAVVAHFKEHLPDSMLHASHFILADVQWDLIGELAISGWPLAVLPEQESAEGAGSEQLPRGRRDRFKSGEALALKRELERITRPAIEKARTLTGSDQQGVLLGAAARAGELGFLHISGIFLPEWLARVRALYSNPTPAALAYGNPPSPDDLRRYDELIAIHLDLKDILLMRNLGLACDIAVKLFDEHPYLARDHRKNDISSIVKGHLTKSILCFNPYLGHKFSTFATTAIKLSLKRDSVKECNVLDLSDEDKTALPEINTLAEELEIDREHPNFFTELAERFNRKKQLKGRSPMTASRAMALLGANNYVPIGPVDDDGETRELQISSQSYAGSSDVGDIDSAQTSEVAEVVAKVLTTKFTPGEEFVLSMLHHASPRPKAMLRLNAHIIEDTRSRGQKAIQRAAASNKGKVRLIPGTGSYQTLRSSPNEEEARRKARGDGPDPDDAGK